MWARETNKASNEAMQWETLGQHRTFDRPLLSFHCQVVSQLSKVRLAGDFCVSELNYYLTIALTALFTHGDAMVTQSKGSMGIS